MGFKEDSIFHVKFIDAVQGPKGDAFKYEDFTPEQLDSLRGPEGPKGDKGDKGDKGEDGIQGPKGDKGDTGATGPIGPRGLKGDTGERGERGLPGPKGSKGDKGDPGEDGIQGPKGDKGDKGDTGVAGPKGSKGDPGQRGERGPQGIQGETGPSGPKGENGNPGVQIVSDESEILDETNVAVLDEPDAPTIYFIDEEEYNALNAGLVQHQTEINTLKSGKADKLEIPSKLSDLNADSTHRTVTDAEKTAWNGKSTFSGNYNDLSGKPTIPTKTSQLSNDSGYVKNVDGYEGWRIKGGINSIVNNSRAVSINPAINGLGYARLRYGSEFNLYFDGHEMFMTDAQWDRFFDGKLSTYVRFNTELSTDARNAWSITKEYEIGQIVYKRNSANAIRWYRARTGVNSQVVDETTTGDWEYLLNSSTANADSIDFQKYDITISIVMDFKTSIGWEQGLSLYWRASAQNAKWVKVSKWNNQTEDWHATTQEGTFVAEEVANTFFFGSIPTVVGNKSSVTKLKIDFKTMSNSWTALCQIAVTGLVGGLEGTVLNLGGGSLFGDIYPYENYKTNLGGASRMFNNIFTAHLRIGSTEISESQLKNLLNILQPVQLTAQPTARYMSSTKKIRFNNLKCNKNIFVVRIGVNYEIEGMELYTQLATGLCVGNSTNVEIDLPSDSLLTDGKWNFGLTYEAFGAESADVTILFAKP